jgi:hypothetical protein
LSWRSHWYSACNQIGCKSPRTFGIKVGCNAQVGISNKLNPIFFENDQLQSPLKPSSEKNITNRLHYLTEFKSCSLNTYAEGIGTRNSYASTWNATESRLSHLRWFPRPNKLKWVCLSCKQECCVLADSPEAARIRDQRQICGPEYL